MDGSVRVSTGAPPSQRLSKYSPRQPAGGASTGDHDTLAAATPVFS